MSSVGRPWPRSGGAPRPTGVRGAGCTPPTCSPWARSPGAADSPSRPSGTTSGSACCPRGRTAGGQRRFERGMLRRLAFIRAARNVGLEPDRGGPTALASLPAGRTPPGPTGPGCPAVWRGAAGRADDALAAAARRAGLVHRLRLPVPAAVPPSPIPAIPPGQVVPAPPTCPPGCAGRTAARPGRSAGQTASRRQRMPGPAAPGRVQRRRRGGEQLGGAPVGHPGPPGHRHRSARASGCAARHACAACPPGLPPPGWAPPRCPVSVPSGAC